MHEKYLYVVPICLIMYEYHLLFAQLFINTLL